jgi:hypothetical protein
MWRDQVHAAVAGYNGGENIDFPACPRHNGSIGNILVRCGLAASAKLLA